MSVEREKQVAAEAAAELAENGMTVGLGTDDFNPQFHGSGLTGPNQYGSANHHYQGGGSGGPHWESHGGYNSSDGGDDGFTYDDWGTRKSGDGFAQYTLGQVGTDYYTDSSSGGGSVVDGKSNGSNSQVTIYAGGRPLRSSA